METLDNGKTNVSPWTCARAEFRVLTPEKGRKQRRKQIQHMKGIASEGLNSTPYVRIQWMDSGEETALFDTGAQWSLICEGLLSEEERLEMQSSSLSGRGVSGEKIPVVGEVWRSLKIGGLVFEKQWFIVVERMICPIILGIDFWYRVSGLSFDFIRNVMKINGGSEEVKLLHHPSAGNVAEVAKYSTNIGEDEQNMEVIVAYSPKE